MSPILNDAGYIKQEQQNTLLRKKKEIEQLWSKK